MVEYVKSGALKMKLEKLKKYRYPALILALGVLLLLLPFGTKAGQRQEPEEDIKVEARFDLDAFCREAESILSSIQGAGEVRLMLTLESDGETTYLLDQLETSNDSGGQSQTNAVLVNRDGDQHPVPLKEQYPVFRGAVVVCSGDNSPGMILAIKEAVSSLTGLGMDKITVLKSA